jgi:hypothetical protein
MSDDDTVALALWYQLMSDRSFAAEFYAYDAVCRSLETRRVVRWFPKDHQ